MTQPLPAICTCRPGFCDANMGYALPLSTHCAREVHTSPPLINPKELAGSKKPRIWSVFPRWVMLGVGRIMSVGAAKYGVFNYRVTGIAASTYEDAMERHAALWFDGEDNDPETGESHLYSVIASCILLLDAQRSGTLVDDREKTGAVREMLNRLEKRIADDPKVVQIKSKYEAIGIDPTPANDDDKEIVGWDISINGEAQNVVYGEDGECTPVLPIVPVGRWNGEVKVVET